MSEKNLITDRIKQSIDIKQALLSDKELHNTIDSVANECIKSLRSDGKILFCGNGGSAADAQHLAAELSGRFYYDRPPLDADALHVNTSYLTAVGNDYGFENIYERSLRGSARSGDVLIAISTSGNSPNILKALEYGNTIGMITVGMTGKSGGKINQLCKYLIEVPSTDTPRIQEVHIMLGHIICELIEKNLFPKENN